MADEQLAEAEARRNADSALDPNDRGRARSPRARSRSRSVSLSSSVSTISTNKSRSQSRSHSRDRSHRLQTNGETRRHRSKTPPDYPRKRKHRSISSSYSRSPRSPRRAPGSHHKSRRHRTISPIDRGRPSSMRRGSHRSRSNSASMDKSQITKQRKSLDAEPDFEHEGRGKRFGGFRPSGQQPRELRRERSLSPYSKRLALTQAMNL